MFDATNLRVAMARKNVTIKDVARQAGLSVPSVSFLLKGKGNPRMSTLLAIARVLDCEASDLFFSPSHSKLRASDSVAS